MRERETHLSGTCLSLRCGSAESARSVWGGGVGDGERGDVAVGESGGDRELHPGPLPAEISH